MKRNFLYGMTAFAALGLASCSSETLDTPGGNEPSQADRKVYVNLAIKGDLPGTRTSSGNGSPNDDDTDFIAGEGQESAINNVYFVFYDNKGDVVGNIVEMNISQFTEQTGFTPSNTVEKKYYSVVEVEVLKGQTAPTQVMCYANPISPTSLQNPLSTIQTVTRQEVTTTFDRKTYFPMSNSVYYNGEDVVMTAPVAKTFDTYAEAKSELDNLASTDITDIYLERYASRLNFSFPEENATYTAKAGAYNADGTFNTEGPAVVLTFNVDGWDVNARANTTYAVKSFRKRGTAGEILSDNETFSNLDNLINDGGKLTPGTGTWAWNNDDYHRSYWGKSPAYFQSTYPEVASDLQGAVINQTYLSYNDIKGKGIKEGKIDGSAHYYRETTVGQDALKSANPAAAMPSVVIVGHYSMTVGGTAAGTGTDGVSFYTYQDYTETTTTGTGESAVTTTVKKPYIYFDNKANGYESAVTGSTSMLYRFLKQQSTLRKKEGDIYRIMTPDELVSICEVKHPVITNPNEKLADRRVTLQIKDGATTTGIYVANGNGYQEIGTGENQITLAAANDVLRNQVGYAIYYNGGMGFYNIPVRHLGWYRQGNVNKNNTKIDWGNVNVGDFGMVRNHAYNIIVDNVFGIATGIAGADTPIVPPSDYTEYYMALRINILKWAIVPSHHIDL